MPRRRVRGPDFEGLVEEGNDFAFQWPVAKRYSVFGGQIYASDDKATTIFPLLQHPNLFLSFALLGRDGEPSERRLLDWVHKYGLLTCATHPEWHIPELWRDSPPEMVEPAPIKLSDFRAEVRTADQLLTLYAEIRDRNTEAVIKTHMDPPKWWPHTPPSCVDDYLSEWRAAASKKYGGTPEVAVKKERAYLEKTTGVNAEAIYVKSGLRILIGCVNRKLENVRLLLDQNWWEVPPPGSTSIGLRRWYHCLDLLSAMYLQFYLLITEATPIRRCANPHCDVRFPAKPKHRRFCKPGCRSTGRNYRD